MVGRTKHRIAANKPVANTTSRCSLLARIRSPDIAIGGGGYLLSWSAFKLADGLLSPPLSSKGGEGDGSQPNRLRLSHRRAEHSVWRKENTVVPGEEFLGGVAFGSLEGLWVFAVNNGQLDDSCLQQVCQQHPISRNSGHGSQRHGGHHEHGWVRSRAEAGGVARL